VGREGRVGGGRGVCVGVCEGGRWGGVEGWVRVSGCERACV